MPNQMVTNIKSIIFPVIVVVVMRSVKRSTLDFLDTVWDCNRPHTNTVFKRLRFNNYCAFWNEN